MGTETNLTCRNLRDKAQPLLDDLLKEEDYQEARLHLKECPGCRKHLRSFDALSNDLEALGEAPVPQDLRSDLLFELKEMMKSKPSPELRAHVPLSKPLLIGALALGLFSAAVFLKNLLLPAQEAPRVSTQIEIEEKQTVPGRTETPAYLEQLKKIHRDIGAGPLFPDLPHRHFHAPSSQRADLLSLAIQLSLKVQYESRELLVLKIPESKKEEFFFRLEEKGGLKNETKEAALPAGTSGDETVSVYFTGETVSPERKTNG